MIARSPFVLPSRGSPARLPFLLLPVLVGTALLQLALPAHLDLPAGGLAARIGDTGLPPPPPLVMAPQLLASRDPFAPVAAKSGAAGQTAPADPLGGAVIAGVVQNGRQRLGVIQRTDGSVRFLALGGTLAGWRLAALTPLGARLTRGRQQTLLAAYGTHPSPPRLTSAPGSGLGTAEDNR